MSAPAVETKGLTKEFEKGRRMIPSRSCAADRYVRVHGMVAQH